jgi:hypothetical protein
MTARQIPGWRVLLDRLHQSQHHRWSRSCSGVPLSFFLMPSRASSTRGNAEGTCLIVRPHLRSAISGPKESIYIEFFYAYKLSLANKQNAAFTP